MEEDEIAAEVEEQEDDLPAGPSADIEDSLALTRTKAAYQPDNKRGQDSLKEKRSPQRVVTAHMNQLDPLTADDIDDETLIAPGRKQIGSAYNESGQLKVQKHIFKPVAESSGGDDTLSLQSQDKRSAQTVSFKVKGIQWRAGYAEEFGNTPLGHAIHPLTLPAYNDEIPESIKQQGIVIRPVNPRLRVVLNQLLPPQFRKMVSRHRKQFPKMRLLAIFYLPGTPSASVGFVHEFTMPKSAKRFYLYIQTSVGKAPIAILDEVLKTLEAGLPEGEKADDLEEYEVDVEEETPDVEFDFAGEVEQAMKQVGSTWNDSMVVYGMRQGSKVAKDWSLEIVRLMDRAIARCIRMGTAIVIMLANSPIIRAMAAMVQFVSKITVRTVWLFNRIVLGIVRSPLTRAIFENIVRVFKVIGRLIWLVGVGIKTIVLSIASAFSFLGNFVRAPGEAWTAVSIEFPSFKFGDGKGKDLEKKRAQAANKQIAKKQTGPLVTAKASPKRNLPPPRPIAKGKALPGPPGAKPPIPNLPAASGGGSVSAAKSKKDRDRELGYFEDQAF